MILPEVFLASYHLFTVSDVELSGRRMGERPPVKIDDVMMQNLFDFFYSRQGETVNGKGTTPREIKVGTEGTQPSVEP